MQVKHDKVQNKFFVILEGQEALIEYRMEEKNTINFLHTYVPEEFRGKGVAEALAKESLRFAKENELQVVATCRFMAVYIKRNS